VSGGPASPAADRGLPPRPAVDPTIVVMVAAAVDQVWPRPAPPAIASDDENPAHRTWRFSGRWWSRPMPARRDRPWVG
jgi:hypothetical protein